MGSNIQENVAQELTEKTLRKSERTTLLQAGSQNHTCAAQLFPGTRCGSIICKNEEMSGKVASSTHKKCYRPSDAGISVWPRAQMTLWLLLVLTGADSTLGSTNTTTITGTPAGAPTGMGKKKVKMEVGW